MQTYAQRIDATTEADSPPSMAVLHARWSAAHEQMEQEYARLDQASAAAAELYPARPPINAPEYALWERQAQAIESSFGVPGLTECAERAFKAAERLAKEILSMTAQTPAEIGIKYGLMLIMHGDGGKEIEDGAPFYAFLAEILPVLDKYQALYDVASAIVDVDEVMSLYSKAQSPA
jgi:hypothetical protein